MRKEDLLRNKGYWISKIQIDLFHQIESFMKENDLNRSQLAKKLGVTKGYISQILNGDFNYSISKLVELSLLIDKAPEIQYRNLDQLIQEDKQGYITISWDVKIKKTPSTELNLPNKTDNIAKQTEFNEEISFEPLVSNYS